MHNFELSGFMNRFDYVNLNMIIIGNYIINYLIFPLIELKEFYPSQNKGSKKFIY
jgi:hypothetical protein